MRMVHTSLCVILIVFLFSSLVSAQENWQHWRGPNHNGISNATNLPVIWSSEKNIAWKTELPSWSAGTPIIWGDQIFITSPSKVDEETVEAREKTFEQNRRGRRRRAYLDPGGSKLLLLCISKKDGKILWQRELDNKNELHRKANDSSPSPVTDGKYVWVITGTGVLTAFNMQGDQIWQRKLQEEYGKFGLNFGYGSSPLLLNGQLIIQVIHGYKTEDPSYILSMEAKTGKTLWRKLRITDAIKESKDSYTTPLIFDNGKEKQLIISGGDYVTGHDPDTGEEIWRAGGMNPMKRSNFRVIASPVIADGIIYLPTRKKPLQAFRIGRTGDITESSFLWKWEGRGAPDVPSPLCDGKYFYMVDDKGLVTCLDAKAGTVIWGPERTSEGIVSASPILADGKIFFVNEKAVTTIVKEGPEFELVATNELDGTYTLASPAISGNQIFIRSATYLYCIGKD
ncbi:PQQ-binding-like beta-propeller repeat protein [candidate division KSB1 bacterium]|nr:PQQ-binding-like beta-propeller repeat protein [candidate division KSB1 bacterium]MBL7092653.1 PQQ-binding-like beta-propeller repeat protein [candidate division KSB1 bacterium]